MNDNNLNNMLDDVKQLVTNEYIMVSATTPVINGQTVSLDFAETKSYKALVAAAETTGEIFITLGVGNEVKEDTSIRLRTMGDFYVVGMLCRIKQLIRLPKEKVRVIVKGYRTMQIVAVTTKIPYFKAELEPVLDVADDPIELEALKNILRKTIEDLETSNPKISSSFPHSLSNVEKFCNESAEALFLDPLDIQKYIEINSLTNRLELIDSEIHRLLEVKKLEEQIETKLRENMEKNNKNYYLREKIKTIHEELGDDVDEIQQYKERIENKNLPQIVKEKAEKELSRMSKMPQASPEGTISRTYLDLILDLPWEEYSEEKLDLDLAEKVLNEDHYGLDKVKKRIIEYLAVRSLKPNSQAPILCFVGPPGVGKTSIVTSIARAANREFISMSLGGIRDEAEIRGHRKTYIGALPGRIISALRDTKVSNPVFLLDEIDKIGSDYKGDPAAALLEVLDYKQNDHFKDNFLELPYDLSKVMFITTANTLDTISPPLLDRMEVIELSGYTDSEKLEIAKKYLVSKQCDLCGIEKEKVSITNEAILSIIHGYTRESGVRNLEREIGAVLRKIAVEIVKGDNKEKYSITAKNLATYLGPNKFTESDFDNSNKVGEVTGLAWTSVGGVTLQIEVASFKNGKGDVKITGQLGDVMRESVLTSLSVVRVNAEKLGIEQDKFINYDIHVHVPEGATPKDGPSAGITITTAIASELAKKEVRGDTAMTGEITLTGKVLAIGGIKEKSMAALRHGKKRLIIPKENHKNVVDIPEEVKKALEIIEVSDVSEVFKEAFV